MKITTFIFSFILSFFSLIYYTTQNDDGRPMPPPDAHVETQYEAEHDNHHDEAHHDDDDEDEEITNLFSLEWEQKMSDYEPSYVYMIPIRPKKAENFFEEITKVPVNIRGAFLTDENKKDKIELTFLDPLNKMIYKNFTNECIFNFEAKTPGRYRFNFRNAMSKQELKVTFTMNTYQEEIIKKEHLSVTEEKIDTLKRFVDKIQIEKDLLRQRLKQRRASKIKSFFNIRL